MPRGVGTAAARPARGSTPGADRGTASREWRSSEPRHPRLAARDAHHPGGGAGPGLRQRPDQRPGGPPAPRLRGRQAHEAVAALAEGRDESVSPRVAPYLEAFRKFLADSGCRVVAAEVEVAHPLWRYAGRLDLLAWLRGRRAILDVKTGASEGADYQVAGYVDAWNIQHPTERAEVRGVIEVREDKTYRYREINLPRALNVWRAALVVHGAITGR